MISPEEKQGEKKKKNVRFFDRMTMKKKEKKEEKKCHDDQDSCRLKKTNEWCKRTDAIIIIMTMMILSRLA